MAGRNHPPPNALKLREIPLPRGARPIDEPRLLQNHLAANLASARPHHPSSILEDRIAIQHREIQSLLVDNRQLAATHVALKQELAFVQQELRHLSLATADVKAERDDQVREVYEKSLKMEAEVRSIDAMSSELVQVRADKQKLTLRVQELRAELQAINGDLAKAKTEGRRVPDIKAEIETMRQEIQKGRAAIEYEKKTHAINLEQGQMMEKNRVILVREIEKLRAELANADKRARAAAAAAANPSRGYTGNYGNPEMGYGGSSYPDPYAMHQPLQVQGVTDVGSSFASGTVPSGPYDGQQTQAHI